MRNSLNEDKDSGAPGSKPAERKRRRVCVWGGGRCPGPPRLPEDHPAGEITRTARLATSSAQIPERNLLSRRGSRVTAPDSAAVPAQPPHSHPPNPPGWSPPPAGAAPVSGTDLWTSESARLMKRGGAKAHPRSALAARVPATGR